VSQTRTKSPQPASECSHAPADETRDEREARMARDARERRAAEKTRKEAAERSARDKELGQIVDRHAVSVERGIDYHPAFVRQVIELGAKGRTEKGIARELGVSWDMLDTWTRDHPEFGRAMVSAYQLSFSYWMHRLQEGISDPRGFNDRAFSKFMLTHYPNDYRDQAPQKVELSGLLANINVEALDDETLLAFAADPVTALVNLLSRPTIPLLPPSGDRPS
jgi:hypothetical protein